MRLQHILFDNDGVLVNTEQWYFEATRMAISKLDVSLPLALYMEHMVSGKSAWEHARSKGISEATIKKHKSLRDDYYQKFLISENIEIEGVRETLNRLANDYKMAIVTTSKRRDFELIHQDRNITEYMEFVLALGDYPRSKPEPDPYLTALEKFNAQPESSVVIEDSVRGLRSALAAKIPCIIIRNHFTQHQDFAGALDVLDSIKELPDYLTANFKLGFKQADHP